MTVKELAIRCSLEESCENCSVRQECNRYQKIINMPRDCICRPDLLNSTIDLLIDIYSGDSDLTRGEKEDEEIKDWYSRTFSTGSIKEN